MIFKKFLQFNFKANSSTVIHWSAVIIEVSRLWMLWIICKFRRDLIRFNLLVFLLGPYDEFVINTRRFKCCISVYVVVLAEPTTDSPGDSGILGVAHMYIVHIVLTVYWKYWLRSTTNIGFNPLQQLINVYGWGWFISSESTWTFCMK